jgi:tetratricopeptide (TPR) repeat protein
MYSRVGKPREAIKRYQRFIELYPSDEKLDRAYLNIVDVVRDQGEDQEALKWCERTEKAFNAKPPAAVAIFTAVRIHLARGDAKNALVQLDRLRNSRTLAAAFPAVRSRLRSSCFADRP